jgi:CO/xanthine dehydrogenase Mo-binding subunit
MRRRDFLKGAGAAGLFVTFPVGAWQEPEHIPARPAGYPSDFNAYLKIGADGRVGCFVGKVELGQGNMTSLAQLAAEELDVGLDRVDMVMGDTDLCPWDMGTFGSLSIWQFGPVLRAAAAEARAVLVQMAAERLGAPVERLRVDDGVVSVEGDPSRKVAYGALVEGRRVERHLPEAKVKAVAKYRIVGHDAPRKDARLKVTGAARYAADIPLEGALYACVLRPPAHGAKLKSLDASGAEALPGVRVVREGDLVAVLHPRSDLAREALGRLKPEFLPSPSTLDDSTIYGHLEKAAPPAKELASRGALAQGEALSVQRLDADYLNAYVAHAPMEPHAASAKWENGRVTVWASTQAPFMVKAQVAQALGIPPKDVRVITPFVGGGFGGKSAGPQAVEAARLARAAGRPVKVVWDRREEFFLDTFRPAAVVKVRAGLDKGGHVALWDYHTYCAGDREAESPYEVPHQRIQASGGWSGGNPPGLHPFGIGPWRAPSANTNVFARESHMDALAAKAGADPLAFRLAHLKDSRIIAALRAVEKRFGWVPGPAPSGRGAGVACGVYRNTVVAAMAEVTVDKGTGRVKVKRVVLAQDMGLIVNPDGARQQMEGCVVMGLGYALTEGIRFKEGRVLDENFDTYAIPRFSWIPGIETILIPNPGLAAQGGGEPPIILMGALIANAIHDAVGIRMRELPMTPERILKALKA